MLNSFIMFVMILHVGAASAANLDCTGQWGNKLEIYVSNSPKAPYDRFIGRRCGHVIKYEADFYIVFDPYFKPLAKGMDTCTGVPGSLYSLVVTKMSDTPEELFFTAALCSGTREDCTPLSDNKALRVNKKTGAATMYNVLADKSLYETAHLTCKVN